MLKAYTFMVTKTRLKKFPKMNSVMFQMLVVNAVKI